MAVGGRLQNRGYQSLVEEVCRRWYEREAWAVRPTLVVAA